MQKVVICFARSDQHEKHYDISQQPQPGLRRKHSNIRNKTVVKFHFERLNIHYAENDVYPKGVCGWALNA